MTEPLYEFSLADLGTGLVDAETSAAEADHKAQASCLDCGHLPVPPTSNSWTTPLTRCGRSTGLPVGNVPVPRTLRVLRRVEYEVELGFLCSEHHDHYVDGYRKRY